MSPKRSLGILIVLIPVFASIYIIALTSPGMNGIWKEWPKDRLRKDEGDEYPTLLSYISDSYHGNVTHPLIYAFYFSVLSAFHLGWREINVGTWIARLNPKEFNLGATGWAKVVSGVQSIIGLYLLIIWALTSFGHPFEW
ncbi:MAG: hypothetical protein HQK59_13055 [Deltaproteobacteria bacterium]|nr:hypothetical protein [Deltaproteobacteria bacterium]